MTMTSSRGAHRGGGVRVLREIFGAAPPSRPVSLDDEPAEAQATLAVPVGFLDTQAFALVIAGSGADIIGSGRWLAEPASPGGWILLSGSRLSLVAAIICWTAGRDDLALRIRALARAIRDVPPDA